LARAEFSRGPFFFWISEMSAVVLRALCAVSVACTAPFAAAASTQIDCIAERACMATTCRDAAGMDADFTATFDADTAQVVFTDPTQPTTEALQYGGDADGGAVYFFSQPDLRVAFQVFATETPIRVRLAFGDPDAPEQANQIFATCAEVAG